MPVDWIFLHVAPVGHCVDGPIGLQMSAHCDGVLDGGFSSAQVGCAVAPAGAPGHGEVAEQLGEQKLPCTPVICTADSPAEHLRAQHKSVAFSRNAFR